MLYRDSSPSDEEKFVGGDALPRQPKLISLPKSPLRLDEERIFKASNDYRNWSFSGCTIKDLPAFDSSASFGITADDENSNIKVEIKNLVQFVESEKPPLFDCFGDLGRTDTAGFKDLVHVVDQIQCNINIIRHDNACLALDHYVRESFYRTFEESRRIIRQRYGGEPSGITGHSPKILTDETKNTQAYHALVDFIFQCLAWWLMHITAQKPQRAAIIALLSRWSVKLKFIALDPVRWAKQALLRGEDVMRRISNDQKDEDRTTVQFPSHDPEVPPKVIVFPDDQDLDYYYYLWKLQFREGLNDLVQRSLYALIAPSSYTQRSTGFNVRTLIYRSDLDGMMRQLTVQRDRTVETSSDLTDLRYSYRALQLLLSNARSIPQKDADASSSETANINWDIKLVRNSDADVKSITTARLDDVVSVLVPLSLMGSSADLVKALDNPLNLAQEHFDDNYIPFTLDLDPEESPRIEFSLGTRQNENKTSHSVSSNLVPASRSPLIASIEDVNKEIEECDANSINSSEIRLKRNALKVFREYKAGTPEIRDWTLTEDSVRVRTTKYSSIVVAFAIVIIAGSLSVPFVVGERIPGVDPFQFVTFGWLLSGAFLVGAKSRYVENWPWHDFLRGQIVCRSVSELAVASRVPRQAVLLYLLHHEFRNPLVFRGPYHGVFRRRAESGSGGFNIDVPVGHATVLAAGFIVLQVVCGSRETELKVYTQLQDTRVDSISSGEGPTLIFNSLEGFLGNNEERQKMNNKEAIQLKLAEDKVSTQTHEVLGLLTGDCAFV